MMVFIIFLFSFARSTNLLELRREYVRNGMTAYIQGNYEEVFRI